MQLINSLINKNFMQFTTALMNAFADLHYGLHGNSHCWGMTPIPAAK
jgi:hypothetical protein